MDHFHLDELCIIHFMDMSSRFSTAAIVKDKSMESTIVGFEKNWYTHFLYPKVIRGDKAFSEGKLKTYMELRDIKFDLVPQGRHSRSAMESKHATIRSIFIRLKVDELLSKETSAMKAVSISNECIAVR